MMPSSFTAPGERTIVGTYATGDKIHMTGTFDGDLTLTGRVDYLEIVRPVTPEERARIVADAERIGLRVVFAVPVGTSGE